MVLASRSAHELEGAGRAFRGAVFGFVTEAWAEEFSLERACEVS